MSQFYYRPLLRIGAPRPKGALTLAGGWTWFDRVEEISRDGMSRVLDPKDCPPEIVARLTASRAPICDMSFDTPKLMGILNVTPDSFSDGGKFVAEGRALEHARLMASEGADIIDIGGESTRPGADFVEADEEIARTAPVIEALSAGAGVPISIDTRKAPVARAAIEAGAQLVNDVAAFTYDRDILNVCIEANTPLCIMHAQGAPDTMQDAPSYARAALDVYDFLEAQVTAAVDAGLTREQLIVDPGIGFGKTLAHNLDILENLALFHALGCPVLLGASRKSLIGKICDAEDPNARIGGSLALSIHGMTQGVQILRVHDIKDTKQALDVFIAAQIRQPK